MALLRKNIRALSQTLRLFSMEAPKHIMDPIRLMRRGGRAVPTLMLKYADFRFSTLLKEDKLMAPDDWIDVRKELMASEQYRITESTVDMVIVNLCLDMKRINTAMNYLEYLWDANDEMNLSSMITYLKLCYAREDRVLDDRQKKYLIDIYDTVRTKYPIFDASTGECCILGISKTARWKESFEIFEIIKLSCKPRSASFSAIISAAFENNEPNYGWKYLEECLNRLNPEHCVYITYLEYCKRNFVGDDFAKAVGNIFKFWADHDVRPYVDVIEVYENTLKDLGWQIERTSIRDAGICRTCSHQLHNLKISDEEFDRLGQLVHERVIVGEDVYQKTTPKELKIFHQFVKRSKPWDIVIDGLNVSYLTKASKKTHGALVKCAVKMCLGMGKKVLVLGRKHMLRWNDLDINYIKKNAHIFLADNGSADDPYLLYATLRSGPSTMFVSRDLMRQHKCLLEEPDIMRRFKYWQMTHQLSPIVVTSKQGTLEMKVKSPPNYLPVAQNDKNGWHVPYTFEPSLQPPSVYETPRSWVCFRKNNSSTGIKSSPVT